MRNPFLSRLIMPCITFFLLIFCGQQGYVVLKEYKKASDKLSLAENTLTPLWKQTNKFTLFTPALNQTTATAPVKAPLAAEIEGIIRSDEAWLSFAVIKTPAGQRSYREGESLTGFEDAWVAQINQDNVVVNYGGAPQVLALKKPDYFRGDAEKSPAPSTKDPGADNLHLDDYLVLKPLFEQGQLEGFNINPRNASSFFSQSGLQKGDVVVKVNTVDMTKAAEAKKIVASWSKMKEAEVVVRRHAHLENIWVNVLNN